MDRDALRMREQGREPWSRYVDHLVEEINRVAGHVSDEPSISRFYMLLYGLQRCLLNYILKYIMYVYKSNNH